MKLKALVKRYVFVIVNSLIVTACSQSLILWMITQLHARRKNMEVRSKYESALILDKIEIIESSFRKKDGSLDDLELGVQVDHSLALHCLY